MSLNGILCKGNWCSKYLASLNFLPNTTTASNSSAKALRQSDSSIHTHRHKQKSPLGKSSMHCLLFYANPSSKWAICFCHAALLPQWIPRHPLRSIWVSADKSTNRSNLSSFAGWFSSSGQYTCSVGCAKRFRSYVAWQYTDYHLVRCPRLYIAAY